MLPQCVNNGGLSSLVQLDGVPKLEVEISLAVEAVRALACWEARPGEIVTVVAPDRSCYRARLTALGPEGGTAVPFQLLPRSAESPVAIDIYQALPEKERFALILQKLTELGVRRIVPFVCRRSTTLEERDAGQMKSHRWPEVIRRAARQCRRAMLPELLPVISWDEATCMAQSAELKLLLYEGEAAWTLREAVQGWRAERIALLVGPEGGFDPEEVEEARNMGFLPVSLGPRILRTETAAIIGAGLLQYALGDLG